MQTLNITLKYKVKHNPGNEPHLKVIAENYFRSKGVKLEDNLIEIWQHHV